VRASNVLASSGVRFAVLQTVLLIVVFTIAGSLTKLSVKLIYRDEVRTRIQGEVAALSAIDRDKGWEALARVVDQNERRPGGLEYRLETPDGRGLAGDLPKTGAPPGWTKLDWDDEAVPGRPFQDLFVFTQRLPDNTVLTVGQDMSEESRLRHALTRVLFWCGAAGAAIGLILSVLLARGALRRVNGMVTAARAVSVGQMQVRAPTRPALIPDDIDELGATFNKMLDDIATLVNRLRWVSTDIAHDLRTPLTHVRQKLERIKDAAGADPGVLAACQEIDTDIDELLRTFDAMLRLAEIENSPDLICHGPVDLAEITRRMADAYRPDLEASGRKLEVSLVPASVVADADLIAQAIANLIENALRHTPGGATIRIDLAQHEKDVVLSVADDGPGIPARQHEAVLQRFHRLEASRTSPGSGLGLPIVAAVAKRHGARLVLADARPGLKAMLVFSGLARGAG
jgi:signal transduction histidine kinase